MLSRLQHENPGRAQQKLETTYLGNLLDFFVIWAVQTSLEALAFPIILRADCRLLSYTLRT